MMDPAELPLRDIHMPEPVSWWPPAAGWWLLAALAILSVLTVWLVRRWWLRRRWYPRRRAKHALARLRNGYALHRDDSRLIRELSACLRRTALTVAPRSEVAGLTGAAWLAWLDRFHDGQPYQTGVGRVLVDAPYQRQPGIDAQALLDLAATTIDAMTVKRRAPSC